MIIKQILIAILEHPFTQELMPEWYGEMCDKCYSLHKTHDIKIVAPWHQFCKQAVSHRDRKTYYIGPNLLAKGFLEDLLLLADKINGVPVALFWERRRKHCCEFSKFTTPCVGTGPDRRDAIIMGIADAIGIDLTENIVENKEV